MQHVSGSHIKPLLSVTKRELVDFMRERGLEWREDVSNSERAYTRNIVRLDLVPLLQAVAGGEDALYRRVAAISDQSQQLRELLDREARVYSEELRTLPPCKFLVIPSRAEKTFLLTESFAKLSSLSQADIIHTWIAASTGETPTYQLMRKLLGFVSKDEVNPPSKPSRLIDMSEKWFVSKVGNAVKVIHKKMQRLVESSEYYSVLQIKGRNIRYAKVCIYNCMKIR